MSGGVVEGAVVAFLGGGVDGFVVMAYGYKLVRSLCACS